MNTETVHKASARAGKVLVGLVAVLLGAEFLLLGLHAMGGNPEVTEGGNTFETMGFEVIAPIKHPPISAFNEVMRRPLFESDRRQVVKAKASNGDSGAGQRFAKDWRLTGVAIGEERSVAILENARSTEVISLATGDVFESWAIEQIDSNRVVIRSGRYTQEFLLDKNAKQDVSIAERNGVLVRSN